MHGLSRRRLLTSLGALSLLQKPGMAQSRAGRANTLIFVPSGDLAVIDPIWTTSYITRNHGYMIYDTLYATDGAFRVKPQMASGHELSDGGLTWTIRLRDGLRFHDEAPVLARDCVASIRRWGARDGFGQTLMGVTNEVASVDDRTIRFRLKSPFPLLAQALGKLSGPVPFIMPERVASTDPNVQIKDPTGSGPFRFVASEWVAGSQAVYAKFDGYVPRDEKPDNAAGGKVVNVPRVEWRIIPDAATAASALLAGEVDWVELPSADLVPMMARSRDVVISTLDPIGTYGILRFNHLQAPFDDVRARRAVLTAVNQNDYLQAMAGGSDYRECKSFFPCGTSLSTGTGSGVMTGNLNDAIRLMKASAYDGRKVVVLSPSDYPIIAAAAHVTADLLKRMGMQVELVETDISTMMVRRASMKPAADGGWNIFHTTGGTVDFMSPIWSVALRGNGQAAWPGWFTDAKIEAIRQQFFTADGDAVERRLASQIEQEAFDQVPFVPLGQYRQPTAYRRNVTDVLQATAPFAWNLRKT